MQLHKKTEKTPYIMNVLEETEKLMVMQLRFGEKINGISVVNELLDYIDDDTIKSNDSKV